MKKSFMSAGLPFVESPQPQTLSTVLVLPVAVPTAAYSSTVRERNQIWSKGRNWALYCLYCHIVAQRERRTTNGDILEASIPHCHLHFLERGEEGGPESIPNSARGA